jgi:integrase/recombinase XerD
MVTTKSFQSSVASELRNYISHKQTLGRSFGGQSIILLYLDRFLCELGNPSPDLTEETFRQWCQSMDSICSSTKRERMGTVRNFCLYRRRRNPGCFVPDSTQFPKAGPTVQPYIFSDIEISKLLTYCESIPVSVRSPLRASTTRLAVILLYTTGIRRGELLRLTRADYQPLERTLTIHTSKFHKSRILPLPDDVAMEVEMFLEKYKTIYPRLPGNSPLIFSPYCGGRAYSGTCLGKNMNIIFGLAGIKKSNGKFPRIHDFRFSFAVNAILRWYREGINVQAKLPFLAAYLGHISIFSTYYYLRLIEPVAALASSAFGAHYGALVDAGEGGGQ